MSTCRNSKNCPPGYKCKGNFLGLKDGRCSPKSKKTSFKSKSKVMRKSKPKSKVMRKSKQQKTPDLELKQETDPDTVMFSNAWWHYLRENWWKILLKFMLILIVFFAIYGAVVPLINFQPWFSWWKTYGGNKLETSNCFSMSSLAYAKGFSLYYYIGNLFGGIQKKLSLPKLLILGKLMDLYAIGMSQGPGRYLTPKSLCQSIVPDSSIYPFNTPQILSCLGNLKDSDDNKLSSNSTWPVGSDIGAWKKIIQFWGGAAMCPQGAQVTKGPCAKQSPSPKSRTYCVDSNGNFPQTGVDHGNQNQWYSTGSKYLTKDGTPTNDPSEAASDSATTSKKKMNHKYAGNFLWEIYGMPFDSMAIRAFLSGSTSDWNNQPLYLSLLPTALGGGQGTFEAGGWFGVLQATDTGAGTGMSETEFIRAFWSIDEPENLPSPGGSGGGAKCTSSDKVSAVTAGVGAAIGIGIMAILLPEAAPVWAAWAVAAGAAGAGGAASVGSLANSGCL